MHLGLLNRPFVRHIESWEPVALLKFQVAPKPKLLISSGYKKKESKFHTEEQQILGTTVPNVVAAESWCLLYTITLCNFVVVTFSVW